MLPVCVREMVTGFGKMKRKEYDLVKEKLGCYGGQRVFKIKEQIDYHIQTLKGMLIKLHMKKRDINHGKKWYKLACGPSKNILSQCMRKF